MRDVSILTNGGVDLDKSLELLGDLSFYDETLETYLEENKTRINNLKKYLKDLNMEDYAILVHALKSDAKYLGFSSLADIAYRHEMASKANNVDEVNSLFDELMEEVDKYNKLSKEYLK